MQYIKISSDDTIIEFHNNWLGEETVIVGGQIVSKKSSIWGTHHYFTVLENGHNARYVLTTKIDGNMQVFIDLKRNGAIVHENMPVPYGTRPRKPKNKAKKKGITKLNEYELDGAITDLTRALDIDPDDPEIYFYLACAYSIQEETSKGFECLKKAVAHKLQNTEMILNHDMLAFLRLHEAFEVFLNSNFTEYDESLMKAPKDE